MENTIKLSAESQNIKLDITDPNWCKCWLQVNPKNLYLGAESLKYIQTHFLSGFMNKPSRSHGSLSGKEVHWILSLMEAHHALYITSSPGDKTLFWQDKHANIISEIEISVEKMEEWVTQLKAI